MQQIDIVIPTFYTYQFAIGETPLSAIAQKVKEAEDQKTRDYADSLTPEQARARLNELMNESMA